MANKFVQLAPLKILPVPIHLPRYELMMLWRPCHEEGSGAYVAAGAAALDLPPPRRDRHGRPTNDKTREALLSSPIRLIGFHSKHRVSQQARAGLAFVRRILACSK